MNLSPTLQPRPYSSRPRRGGGRLVPARCGGGEWSSGIRRRGRKPPFRACAGVPSARSWAAVRAVRRGRTGRVRDKRVNSPAHPGPAAERPRGALRRRRNGPPLPLRRASPGRSAPSPTCSGAARPGGEAVSPVSLPLVGRVDRRAQRDETGGARSDPHLTLKAAITCPTLTCFAGLSLPTRGREGRASRRTPRWLFHRFGCMSRAPLPQKR